VDDPQDVAAQVLVDLESDPVAVIKVPGAFVFAVRKQRAAGLGAAALENAEAAIRYALRQLGQSDRL
jgi:hypothetical protein